MIHITITVFISILFLFTGIYVVSKYPSLFSKYRLNLLLICMVLGIFIYTVGYLAKYPSAYLSSALMAIFSTGRMFVLENDISSFENEVSKIPYYKEVFSLIMAFSMLTTGMVVLSFMGYRIMSRIQLIFMKILIRNKCVYLFTAINKKSLYLADDIRNHNKKAVILFCVPQLTEEEEEQNFVKIASEKGYILATDYKVREVCQLCRRLQRNTLTLFAIHEEDNDNLEFINKLAYDFQICKKKVPLTIYVFIRLPESEDLFHKEEFTGLDLHLIDENDLYARQLFQKFTLAQCLGDSNILTVCVTGHSKITEHIYRNITYLGQFHGVKLKIILVDENIEDRTARFFHQNPEIHKCAQFIFLNTKIGTKLYFTYFNQEIQNINCLITTDNSMETAAELSRICIRKGHPIKLCVLITGNQQYHPLVWSHLFKEAIIFGSDQELYTEGIIINENLDLLAKGFHSYYSQLYDDPRTWEDISLFEKQSNRALALHIQEKLHSIGLRIAPGGDTKLYEESLRNTELLEMLSMGEHLRWNAFSFANGWRTMKQIHEQTKNKNPVTKEHSCLVSWEDLTMISDKFGKDYKEMDRHLIRNIGNVLRSVNWGVEKMN